VAGTLAVVGLAAVVSLVILLWRLMARRPGTALMVGSGAGGAEAGLMLVNPIEQANARFLQAIEQLEQRIRDMETARPVTPVDVSAETPAPGPTSPAGEPSRPADEAAAPERVRTLLSKGQSLMHLGQVDAALGCFAEALELDPLNPDAHLKRAAALEKLDRLDEALQAYDAALERDSTLTMAYLGKGSVFNRLERHGEALRCYEQALRTQHHTSVAE
jgi:tetratricopeptide (TPR) repeat protein